MAVSTIPAFRGALLTRLQADGGLAGVQVVRGNPFPAAPLGEMVSIGNCTAGSTNLAGAYGGGQSSAGIGTRSREERYVTDVICSVITNERNDQGTVEDRAMAVAGVITDSIRAWAAGATPWTGISLPTGARWGWVLVNSVTLTLHMGDTQREARATVELACSARV